MVRVTCLLIIAALAGCSSSGEDAPSPASPPDTYDFRLVDTYAEIPRDHCRFLDRDFQMKFMERINKALQGDPGQTAKFEQFFVQEDPKTSEKQAAIRFIADHAGGPAVPMIAVGAFDPATCTIGAMRAGPMDSFYTSESGKFGVP